MLIDWCNLGVMVNFNSCFWDKFKFNCIIGLFIIFEFYFDNSGCIVWYYYSWKCERIL